MRTIIAGGRDYYFTHADLAWLNDYHAATPITEVVCGGASGADYAGKTWAEAHGVPVKTFPANWTQYGRAAGPRRNRQMAEYADALIAFPGGDGTANMITTARKYRLRVTLAPVAESPR
jgi:hypothetical protein